MPNDDDDDDDDDDIRNAYFLMWTFLRECISSYDIHVKRGIVHTFDGIL